jgi:hypothetical protein
VQAKITIAAFLTLLTAAGSSVARENIPWDPNCSPINRALADTWSADRLSAMLYEVKPDGTLRPHMEGRFTEAAVYERNLASAHNKWTVSRREGWSLWDRFGPRFSGCKLAAQDSRALGSGSRYTANWYGFPYKADAEVWPSPDDKTVSKLLRHYDGTNWQFPFPNVLVVFNLDPASAVEPAGVAPPE